MFTYGWRYTCPLVGSCRCSLLQLHGIETDLRWLVVKNIITNSACDNPVIVDPAINKKTQLFDASYGSFDGMPMDDG